MYFTQMVLILTLLVTACSSSRPSRPDGVPGSGDSTGYGSKNSGGGAAGPGGGKVEIDPVTGQPIKSLTLNVVDSRSTMRISSVEVLINKLKVVTTLAEASESIKLARTNGQSLGAYNHAQGVLPENKWTLDKMAAWNNVVDLACREKTITDKIAKAGGDKLFLETAYGREITADETAMFKELKLTGARRARVICTAVLSSGEFVSL